VERSITPTRTTILDRSLGTNLMGNMFSPVECLVVPNSVEHIIGLKQ